MIAHTSFLVTIAILMGPSLSLHVLGSFICVLHVFIVILMNVFIFVTDVLKQEHFGIAVFGELTCEQMRKIVH